MESCGLELRNKTKKELVEICKLNEIKGCSNKSKSELIKYICSVGVIKPSVDRQYVTATERAILETLDHTPLTEYGLASMMDRLNIMFPYDRINQFKRKGFIIEEKKSNGDIVYKCTQKGRTMFLPWLKQIMKKRIPKHVMRAFNELGGNSNEYSIGLDFEDPFKDPEQIYAFQGGIDETLHLQDWEVFGHTHPNRNAPLPSTADIKNMKLFEPEFISAGGHSIILILENKQKHDKWKRENINKEQHSYPIDIEWVKRHYKKIDNVSDQFHLIFTKEGRKIFYNETGVRVEPWYPMMQIPMIKDAIREKKRIFNVPTNYLSKWHAKRYSNL